MLFQLGSSMAGKHYALGRAILFEGAAEAERVFSLAAFEDVLLGRSLAPVLEGGVRPAGRNAVAVELVNRSHQATVVSRVANWVEVDLAPARPADVQLGGFDRYEVYDAAGRPVTPGRATRVRLFETLVAPAETVDARADRRAGSAAGQLLPIPGPRLRGRGPGGRRRLDRRRRPRPRRSRRSRLRGRRR